MKRKILFAVMVVFLGAILTACSLPSSSSGGLEGTRVAIAIQQTSLVMQQTQVAQAVPATSTPEVILQPTYTPYPTYTSQVQEQLVVEEEEPLPTATQPEVQIQPSQTYEDWLDDVNILVYDDMIGMGGTRVIENAIDAHGLGSNTKNVGDAMGDFLSAMNSATEWDLIIIGAESRDSISGEYFDVLADMMDRGSSIILEIWYIDDISFGRIQPVMQRCGIAFHRDWFRDTNSDLNEYLVYLLEPGDPLFSDPNTISMLIPYDTMWVFDVGDMLEINPGSNAVLLAGAQKKEHLSYGLIAECLDGRMVWQTFSTHDYKYQEMINLWENYIVNTLKARYDYLQ